MIKSKAIENNLRSFSMYELLLKPIEDYLEEGDGLDALPVFEEEFYPYAWMIDISVIDFIKMISTGFGRTELAAGYQILERIHNDNRKKKIFRFRSRHPLYADGSSKYQNICLISGMVHMGIPILPYFDGANVIKEDDEVYLAKLRGENSDLI